MELARILRKKRKYRFLMKVAATLYRAAAAEDQEPEQLSEVTVKDLYGLGNGDEQNRGLTHIDEITDAAMASLEARMNGEESENMRRPAPTGIMPVDHEWTSGGFEPGQLIILAARPGIGKSTLAANWAINTLKAQGRERMDPVALFTLEMDKTEVWERVMSGEGAFNLRSSFKDYPDETIGRLKRKIIPELRGRPFYVSDMGTVTVPWIQAELSKLIAKTGNRPAMVVVDYIQLMSSPSDSRAARQSEAVRIGEISRGLKLTAKDFGVPIVALAQLNREVETRGGKPKLTDLRDSGGIEQDADAVYFIHRKMDPDPASGEDGTIAELILAKNRNGMLGVCGLKFDGPTFTYSYHERTTSD